jgi:hypothetical protein
MTVKMFRDTSKGGSWCTRQTSEATRTLKIEWLRRRLKSRGKPIEGNRMGEVGPPALQDKWSWGTWGRGPGLGGGPLSECACILH